jgi:hypothetical protein
MPKQRQKLAPAAAGEPVLIEVRGRLGALVDHDLFRQGRMVGGSMVAEERIRALTR